MTGYAYTPLRAAQIAIAREIAYEAHRGQTDKAGDPYIWHVERVAARVSDDWVACAAAWLHDVFEDQPQYEEQVRARIVPEVVEVVDLVTRRDSDVDAYYARIRAHRIARRLKLEDVGDNEDEERLGRLEPALAERLRRKYRKARQALTG